MRQNGAREAILSYGILVMSVTPFFAHIFDRIYPALFPVFRDDFSLALPQVGFLASILSLFMSLGFDWRFTYIFWMMPLSLALISVWRLKTDEEVMENLGEVSSTEKEIKFLYQEMGRKVSSNR